MRCGHGSVLDPAGDLGIKRGEEKERRKKEIKVKERGKAGKGGKEKKKRGIGGKVEPIPSKNSGYGLGGNQGRRSLWDRGDTSPQYLDWGT